MILRSAGVDPANVSFDFRPLWQMDAAAAAQIALNKAQTTQIYAGLKLWPADVMARLVESQLGKDGTYPGAEAIFGEVNAAKGVVADADAGRAAQSDRQCAADFFNPAQLRDPDGRWAKEGGGNSSSSLPITLVNSSEGEKGEKQINATGGPVPPTEETAEPRPRVNLAPQPVSVPTQPSPFMSLPGAAGSLPAASKSEPLPATAPIVAPVPPAVALPLTPPAPVLSGTPPLTRTPPSSVVKPAGIPDDWIEKPSDKKGGMRWTDPNNSSNFVRAMPGDPTSPYPHQQMPYIIRQNGSYRYVNGKPIVDPNPAKSSEAHIPASQFNFK